MNVFLPWQLSAPSFLQLTVLHTALVPCSSTTPGMSFVKDLMLGGGLTEGLGVEFEEGKGVDRIIFHCIHV